MILGALLGLAGIWWYIPGGGANEMLTAYSMLSNHESFVAMFQGSIGVLAVIVGLFVVWIEHDQIKVQRELQSETINNQEQDHVPTVADGGDTDTDNTNPVDAPTVEDTDSNYRCDTCDRSFDTEHGLTIHRSRVHDE